MKQNTSREPLSHPPCSSIVASGRRITWLRRMQRSSLAEALSIVSSVRWRCRVGTRCWKAVSELFSVNTGDPLNLASKYFNMVEMLLLTNTGKATARHTENRSNTLGQTVTAFHAKEPPGPGMSRQLFVSCAGPARPLCQPYSLVVSCCKENIF